MKRTILFIVIVLACGFGRVRNVLAEGLSYTGFHAAIGVTSDTSIQVTETIIVDYSTPHHGIFRTIPYVYSTTDGGSASIPISMGQVLQDGQPIHFTTTNTGTAFTLKIGDPDRTIRGAHTYTISYQALAAVNFFTDHDELYWNITGADWDAPMKNVSATITLPNGVTDTATVTTACYTGSYGSTESRCQQTHTANAAQFTANDFLTVVVGWPIGLVSKPADYEQLRTVTSASSTPDTALESDTSNLATAIVAILFGIISVVTGILLWWLYSRNRHLTKTIIAQYDPPNDCRPAEAGKIMGSVSVGTLVSATIVDLAVRGYLRIEEVPSPTWLGIGNQHSYAFIQQRKVGPELRTFEATVLRTLFNNRSWPAKEGRVALSTMRKHKETLYDRIQAVSGNVKTSVVQHRWMTEAGGAAIFLGPQLTPNGREALWHLRGFKLFLKTAERYRLQWQERQGIFEQYLPYAMIFGVANHWTEVLGPTLTTPPDWYQGDFTNGFSAALLVSSLNAFTSQVSATTVSTAASGGSGFGGGGFSGGGGGGGGGGGW